jgi:hypothetical protein
VTSIQFPSDSFVAVFLGNLNLLQAMAKPVFIELAMFSFSK